MARQTATDHLRGVTEESVLPMWDDATRTVITYDESGATTSTRPYTADENAAADAAVADAATLTDLAARVARIEARLWPAPPDPTDPTDPTITDREGVWPDGGLLREGGIVWRNVSGVPLTTPPSGFPGEPSAWTHLFVAVLTPEPEPTGPLPWVQPTGAHDAYSFGATVTHTGRVWESTVAGERSNTWAPGVYGWKDLGPA